MDTKTEMDASLRASEQLRQQATTVKDNLRELGRLTKDAASEKLGDVRQSAAEYYEQGREKASAIEDKVEEYVRQKPLQAVLMAAGAGLILGFLLRRR